MLSLNPPCPPHREEIANVMKSSMLQALNLASFFSASKVIIFITFAIYVQLGNTITASSVFVTVSLYSNTATTVTLYFPRAIELLFESYVSVQRIQVRGSTRISPPGMRLIGHSELDKFKHLWKISWGASRMLTCNEDSV